MNAKIRSSRPELFYKKDILNNLQNSQRKTCAIVSLLIYLRALGTTSLLKMISWHRCFPVNVVKFLETLFHRTPQGDSVCEILNTIA